MISDGDLTTEVKNIDDMMSPTVAVFFLFQKVPELNFNSGD